MKKIIRGTLSAILSLGMIFTTAFAETGNSSSQTGDAENNIVQGFELTERKISLPSNMRAVFATPEKDFTLDSFDDMYSDISALGMNAVVIHTSDEDNVYYDTELGKTDIITSAIEAAHNKNISAYVTLDANLLLENVIGKGGGLKAGFTAAAHKFAMKYNCEGILLTDYYTKDTDELYAEYLSSGSGIGYENWLYETNRFVVRTLSEVVCRTSNSTAVGLMIEDMWANLSDNPEGSDTADTVQALYDGHCDTKNYVESQYADFVIVKAYGTTTDSSLNFENVVSWWDELDNKNNVKTYVCHLNERIGTHSGWNEDQLLRQLTVMKDMGGSIGGSAFNSLSSLNSNPLQSTDTLKKFFEDEINTDTLFDELKMTSPTELSYVTYDSSVKFMGTFDENFEVYFDGNKLELNEAGNFYIPKELSVGTNYFTIEHKGKKYEYTIERKVDVLRSAYDCGDITVDGGTQLSFSAIAYSGSSVYVSIGGETVALSERQNSENVDANSSYSEFVGYYTVGDGVIGQEQYLGNISYYAVYGGYEESMWGGSVTVAAKPEPPKEPIVTEIIPDKEQFDIGTGEVVGTIDPIRTDEEYVTYVKVLSNYTDVLDAKTTGAVPSPEFSQMPAGTLDYLKTYSYDYVTTTSGKRYRTEYVTTFDDTGLGYNSLKVNSVGDSGGKSFIDITLDYKSSFNVNTSQTYTEGWHDEGPYGVFEFDAKYVYVTFDNVTSVTKLPDFSSCTLFSAGEWSIIDVDGIPKFRLTLTLRQAGIYSGMDAYYDEYGDLRLTFNIPTGTLAGKTIVISPGHGISENGWDPGAIGSVTEQEINLSVAKKLAEVLQDMGATVVRLETESVFIYDRDRPKVARQYGADMFLEIHCNSAGSDSAHGCEVYYFTPWSQTLAKAVNDNLSASLNSLYGDGTDSSRGNRYSYYWYTLEQGFPSVLVEMGFVSNTRECLLMANSDNQDKMAAAIAQGVYEYFARSGL